jgi:hypothetical protein
LRYEVGYKGIRECRTTKTVDPSGRVKSLK